MIKVIIEGSQSPRERVNTEYEKRKEDLQRLVNSYPLVVNREVFKKTKEEKEQVKIARVQYKNKLKND